jgi:hypothetical protein
VRGARPVHVLTTRGGELAGPGLTCGDHSERAARTCNCGGLVSLHDGRDLDEVVVAGRPDLTREQLRAACEAFLLAAGVEPEPGQAGARADFIADVAASFPVGTPLLTVYDHRTDEWNFVVDPRPELRRSVRKGPVKFTF